MKNNFYKGNTISFGGLPGQDFEKAKIVVIPVPYEATTSYKGGTKKGPEAILKASCQIEEIWGEFIHSKIEKEKLIFFNEDAYTVFSNEGKRPGGAATVPLPMYTRS